VWQGSVDRAGKNPPLAGANAVMDPSSETEPDNSQHLGLGVRLSMSLEIRQQLTE
jgi:hypothetical protein